MTTTEDPVDYSAESGMTPCPVCKKMFADGALSLHWTKTHKGEDPEQDQKLAELMRLRGFMHWVNAQPPDTAAGAASRSVRRAMAEGGGRERHNGPGFKPESKTSRSRSNTRWLDLIEKYKAWLDEQPMVEAHLLADCEFAITSWPDIVKDFWEERAGIDVILKREDYTLIGEAHAPTAELPVPVTRCMIKGCPNWAVVGGNRCMAHGGAWLSPEIRQAMLLTAFEGLVEASTIAVDTLVDVMEHSKRDDARVAAAREVLDRVGISGQGEIHLHLHGDGAEAESTVSKIRNRLTEMSSAMAAARELRANLTGQTDDIIEGEVIEDG